MSVHPPSTLLPSLRGNWHFWVCRDSFLFYCPHLSKRNSIVIKDNTSVVISNLPPVQNFGNQMCIACCCLYYFSVSLNKRLWRNPSIIKQNFQAIGCLNLKRNNKYLYHCHGLSQNLCLILHLWIRTWVLKSGSGFWNSHLSTVFKYFHGVPSQFMW